MSQIMENVKERVKKWWQEDVLSENERSPKSRIIKATLELTAAICVMIFLEKGDKYFELLPSERED